MISAKKCEPQSSKFINIVEKYDVKLIQSEVSHQYFGNILLIIETEKSKLRFVRDRGYNTCEICAIGTQQWVNEDLIMLPDILITGDFSEFVDSVLRLKNIPTQNTKTQ